MLSMQKKKEHWKLQERSTKVLTKQTN
jgi:hypothetical protein